MPLWKFYHPVDAFSPEDKQALSQRITALYKPLCPNSTLGSFSKRLRKTLFILAVCQPIISSEVWVDHIARSFQDDDDLKARWLNACNRGVGPIHRR